MPIQAESSQDNLEAWFDRMLKIRDPHKSAPVPIGAGINRRRLMLGRLGVGALGMSVGEAGTESRPGIPGPAQQTQSGQRPRLTTRLRHNGRADTGALFDRW